jgi:phage tail-like protein
VLAIAAALCLAFGARPSLAAGAADPLVGYHFAVSVAGAPAGYFPVVSGIGSANQVVEQRLLADGLEIVRKIPGRVSWNDVLLERTISADLFFWAWRRQTELRTAGYRRNIELLLIDADGRDVARWACKNAWPSRISAPRPKCGSGLLVAETITLVSEGCSRLGMDDRIAPELSLPADIVAEATSAAGATVAFSASATDNLDPSPTVTCEPPSGSTFALGATPVECTALDAAGNSATGSFTITVQDTTDPELTVPANLVVEPTAAAGTPVAFAASATDSVDAAPLVGCVPLSGSLFPIGTTPVTCTAVDASGNSATAGFTVTVSPNDPPTLDAIGDLSIDEDAGVQTVSLAGITAGPGESQGLAVTAISSDTALIPDPVVTYTGPSATGSLAFAPVANANGSATITVTVDDGMPSGNSFTRTFTVTVNAVNDPPTLSAIDDLTIDEDAGAQTVNLAGITAGPGETQSLTVTTTSSNSALVPDPTVTYASPDSAGNLVLTPTANASGGATITVTVTDAQAATVTRTFAVTVNAVNDPPTLDAIADMTIDEGAGLQTVNLAGITAGPGESQGLTVTATSSNPALIPDLAVTYVSPGATGSVSFTPAAHVSGTATITVTVNDGQSSNSVVTQVFTVAVTPSAYVLWTNAATGQALRWRVNSLTGALQDWVWVSPPAGAGAGWQATAYARSAATDYVLWSNKSTGQATRWNLDPATAQVTGWNWVSPVGGVGAGWLASGYARGDATADYVLWTSEGSGQAIRWKVEPATAAMTEWRWVSPPAGVGAGWAATSYARVDTTTDYVLWTNRSTGQATRWHIDPVSAESAGWIWLSSPAGVGTGWEASSYACVDASKDYLLWTNGRSGQTSRWEIDPATAALRGWGIISPNAAANAGWQASSYLAGE